MLRIWMMKEGLPLVYENRCQYMKTYHHTSRLISYLKSVLEFYQPQCIRPEQEKDVWELDKLDIEFRHNPIKYSRTLDFTKVIQPGIRDELKKGIYLNLQSEAISCIRRELTAMRRLSAYLQERYPEVQTCGDLTRELIEEYLHPLKHRGFRNQAFPFRIEPPSGCPRQYREDIRLSESIRLVSEKGYPSDAKSGI